MKIDGSAFDPETIEILLKSLDEAWARLSPHEQMRISKTILAERILRAATDGKRDPIRLRTCALTSAVHEPPAEEPGP